MNEIISLLACINVVWVFIKFKSSVDDPGMSFTGEINCPQALQTCFDRHVKLSSDTLMSISDGLGPSIFCQKMEKARPMREELDGRVVCFPPEAAFLLDVVICKVLFRTCTLTWRVNNWVSRREKV